MTNKMSRSDYNAVTLLFTAFIHVTYPFIFIISTHYKVTFYPTGLMSIIIISEYVANLCGIFHYI